MNNNAKSPKHEPHHRLTVEDVTSGYRRGHLTAKGAILYIVCASRKLGQPVKVSIKAMCDSLKIHKATYYRAIGELSEEKSISFEASDTMTITALIKDHEIPYYIFSDELSQKCDSESQKCDSESQKCDSESQKCDSKNPEPAQGKGFGKPLSLQSLQSSLSPKKEEREKNTFSMNQIEPDYRNWLQKKANSLPTRPTFIEQWIRKQAPLEANQKEFLFSQNRQVETDQVPAAAAPNLFEIQESCQRAIDFGDRRFALDRLQSLIIEGWADLVESLCSANNWGFLVSGAQIVEVSGS